ncbi:MAG: matrixin [Candidatus Moranbacteria bacterium GW2011_GWE1_35_17]|nr:MAG: matrixin [Candidatus Moranbacteria bacterium GW2011_GWE1_35_17]
MILGGTIFYAQKSEEIKLGARNMLKKANLLTVCDETLYYSLGEIDPRFNISNADIKNVLAQAENVWEKDLNKNVFEYKEGAEFKVNFIFDERQQRTVEGNNLNEQLDKLEEIQSDISKEYQTIEAIYQKTLATYQKNIKDYENRVEEFNAEIKKWNKEGGAPEDEYEDLKKEQKALEKLQEQLEAERKKINALVLNLNELAKKENKTVGNYNEKVQTYKEKFGESTEFNQGEYNGLGINIYQFHEATDLKLVLAHEFGHALEVGHVENPSSIMYYLMEKQDLENIKLTGEDLGAIKGICGIE